jgi:hypothetical protein
LDLTGGISYAGSATNATNDSNGTAFIGNYLRTVTVGNNVANDFNTFKNMTLTGRGDPVSGCPALVNAPWSGAGPAGGYGVLTYLWSNYGTQMAWGYNSNRIYIRPKHYDNGYKWATTWDSLALTSDIPTKVSQLTNDSGFLTGSYLPLAGGTMTGTPYINMPSTAATIADNQPFGITYGRIQSYGTITIAADTDASKNEFVNITAGYGVSTATAANGLSIGYDTLKWKGQNIIHSGTIGSYVGNGTVTIKQNGTSKGTFTMNQSGNTTIELTDTAGTTYSAGTGLSLSGTTFSHADTNTNISTDTSYGPTANVTQSAKNTATFKVPQITLDQFGHVKSVTERTITVTDTDTNTDTDTWRPVTDSVATTSSSTCASATAVKKAYDLAAASAITAGADNTTSKIFLVGPTAQTSSNASARTYSNSGCYASGGYLYSNSKVVINDVVASAGSNINSVGTPNVSASISNGKATLTFNYLKGATGSQGPQGPTGPSGNSVGTVVCVTANNGTTTGTPSTASEGVSYYRVKDTAGNWLSGTIAVKNGKNGTNGTNATTTAVVSTSANGLAPKVTNTSGFLRGDGSWVVPSDTKVKSTATTSAYYLCGSSASATATGELGKRSDVYVNASGQLLSAKGFFESSDERLKNFGESLDVDLDKIKNLPKKYFTWKNDKDNKLNIGTSAQELQKLYPEIVSEGVDGYLSVNYEKLSIIALAAIDKLADKQKELEERLAKIEAALNL